MICLFFHTSRVGNGRCGKYVEVSPATFLVAVIKSPIKRAYRRKVYFASQFEGTAHCGREGVGTGNEAAGHTEVTFRRQSQNPSSQLLSPFLFSLGY